MQTIGSALFTLHYIASGLPGTRLLRRVNEQLVHHAMHTALFPSMKEPKIYWSTTSQVLRSNSLVLYWMKGLLVAQILRQLSKLLVLSWNKTGAQKGV